MRRPVVVGLGGLAGLALIAFPVFATQVKIFRAQSQAAFLAGTFDGVSVDSLGRLDLAPRIDRLAALSEPFLLSLAAHPDGWVVGTGNAGRVLEVDRQGRVSELFAAPEPEVFAVWADPDGTVFAGTSPGGKVYRIPAKADPKDPKKGIEVWFDPGETYIWALARGADGALLVATGTQGKLFRVEGKGKGSVLYDSDDTHVRSMLPLTNGDVLLGTAGEGLILRLDRKGQVRTLYDAPQPEVVALAAAPDGTCYAAVVASEASLVDLSKPPTGAGAAGGGDQGKGSTKSDGEGTVTVTVEGEGAPGGAAASGTPAPGAAAGRKEGAGPRSELLRISPEGVVESLWPFADETVYSLLWQSGSVWVGTGLEGKLYRYQGTQMLLEKDVDERQVVGLVAGQPGPTFATTNAAGLYRVTAGREARGTYTSPPLDAGQVARFGTFRWRGEAPAGTAVKLSFRSGVSSDPDRTWSPWTAPKAGEELSLDGVPRGRYVQWRAELQGGAGDASPRLYGAELSYRQENLPPRIDALSALEPGQILVPANFNPANQVYEPATPNRQGIFTSLEPAADDARAVKPLWRLGYRSLRWSASDPNDDKLSYALAFHAVERGEPADIAGDQSAWLDMVTDLDDDHYSFDSTVLPDGVYRFRLTVSDRPGNEPASARTTEQISEPVIVDHTPPALVEAAAIPGGPGDPSGARVVVRDALNPIREAVYSIDAQEWMPARAEDGLLDAKAETLLIRDGGKDGKDARDANPHLLLLRVTDAAYNVVTFDLSHLSPRR